jgi:hypothetical protein
MTTTPTSPTKRISLLKQRLSYTSLDEPTRDAYAAELATLQASLTAAQKVESYLPVFPGFYGTIFGNEDSEEETQDIEGMLENAGVYQPRELAERIANESSLYSVDYRAYETEYVRCMSDAIGDELSKHIKGFAGFEFQNMQSPREYNFYNDSGNVLAILTDEKLFRAELIRYIEANRPRFDKYIKRRYTSCDGFISGYSNDPQQWIADIQSGVDEIEGHKIGRLLDFVLECEDYTEESLYYDAERPCIGEYASGQIIDLFNRENVRLPDSVNEILNAIATGREQLAAYIELMHKTNLEACERQWKGLKANEGRLYKEAITALINSADNTRFINEDGTEHF